MYPEPRRVKVSEELVEQLSEEWSPPVQVKIDGIDEDGDLELIFRNVPTEEQAA